MAGWVALVIALPLLLAGGALVHAQARRSRLDRLWHEVTATGPQPAYAAGAVDASQAEPPSQGDDAALAIGVAAGVPAANAVWQWTQIDPQFLASVDFSHAASVNSNLDLLTLLSDRYVDLEGASLTGAVTRLKGYLFEEQVHDYLAELHGDALVRPLASNNPGFDFEVGAERFDTKATDTLSNVDTSDPNVTYLVTEDAVGVAGENVASLEGVTSETLLETVESQLAIASGEALLDGASAQVPIATALFTTVREVRAVRRGKTTSTAVEHGIVDTVGRAGGAFAGLQAGAAIGSVAGPPGMAVGSILGAAAGALIGGLAAAPLKRRKLLLAKRRLERRLGSLGEKLHDQLDALEHALRARAAQAEAQLLQLETSVTSIKHSWRWRLWPNFLQVATVAAADVARQDVAQLRDRADRSTQRLHATAERGTHELALLATECPALLELAAVDVGQDLASVTSARDEVATAVRDLALSTPGGSREEESSQPPSRPVDTGQPTSVDPPPG